MDDVTLGGLGLIEPSHSAHPSAERSLLNTAEDATEDVTMDAIEVLAPNLMDDMPELLGEMKAVVRELRVPRGWHYYMDLCWVARAIAPSQGMQILDAGAGNGVMQWWLASQGASVLSVDLQQRPHPGRRCLAWCNHSKRGEDESYGALSVRSFLPPKRVWSAVDWYEKIMTTASRLFPRQPRFPGSVVYWDHDLSDLAEIESDSMDAIVSISALEHNDLANLRGVIAELERVLKPGGRMAITVGGARDEDWFHEPSRGWCFTEKTLAEYFGLDHYRTNFERYDEILEELVGCDFLKDDLPEFYFDGGDNGMPWGRWDPSYQSIGILKTKR